MKRPTEVAYIRLETAAEMLACSVRTVYRLIDRDELIAGRVLSSRKVLRSSVLDYIARTTDEPCQE